MSSQLRVAMRKYPHTEGLMDGSLSVPGAELTFADVSPIHEAFAPMVRELAFDVSELATATWLQASEAAIDIVGLPVITLGNLPHRALYTLDRPDKPAPEDLRGTRIGIRAYAQTTGLWLRGALKEAYGLEASEVTWVTTEGPHVEDAPEPANVERTDRSLVEELRAGEISAVVLGAPFAAQVDGIVPLIPDWERRQEAYEKSHGWVPANHLVVVKGELARDRPDLVRALYRTLSDSIDRTRSAGQLTPQQRAIGHGVSKSLLDMVDTGLSYARDQHIIGADFTAADLFAPAIEILGKD